MESLHVSCHREITSRDFIVPVLIFSMPKGLGSQSPGSMLQASALGDRFLVSDQDLLLLLFVDVFQPC